MPSLGAAKLGPEQGKMPDLSDDQLKRIGCVFALIPIGAGVYWFVKYLLAVGQG
jgi:hypothetical protein